MSSFWIYFSSKNKVFPFLFTDAGSGSGDGGRSCLFVFDDLHENIIYGYIFAIISNWEEFTFCILREEKTNNIILLIKEIYVSCKLFDIFMNHT